MAGNTPIAIGTKSGRLLLTAKQAAEALAISPRKLWGMTASGEIPHVRVGRLLRYPVADLEEWIREHTKGGAAQ